MMPSSLDPDKRRIEAARIREGTYDNLRDVVDECEHVVYLDRKPQSGKPVRTAST